MVIREGNFFKDIFDKEKKITKDKIEIPKTHYAEIRAAINESNDLIKKGDKWNADYTQPDSNDSYEITFQNIIDSPWEDFLIEQKEKQGATAAMDFMGGGSCFDKLPIDKKLAVRLLDKLRTLNEDGKSLYSPPPESKVREVEVISGNVLSRKTWKKVFAWSEKETEGRGVDLILSRPVAGLAFITKSIDVYYFLIEKLWELLNKNGGTLYTQLPIGTDPELNKNIIAWVSSLEKIPDLEAKFGDSAGFWGPRSV